MNQAEIDKRVAIIDAEMSRLSKEKTEILKQTEVICFQTYVPRGGCGTVHLIKDLVYVQTHYWDGCEDWRPGEALFVCPECGLENRLIDELGEGRPKRKFLTKLSHYFKSSEDR